MQPRTRYGLIVGVIGLLLNIFVAALIGFCGPFLSLIAGGLAGYLAVRQERPLQKNQGARIGGTAGGIAGALIIIGQILGGVVTLVLTQASGGQTPFGQLPDFGSPGTQIGFYAGGIATGLCFGMIGALLAAGAGAGAGYLATSDQAMTPPSGDIPR